MLSYFIGKLVGKRMESHLHAEHYESVMLVQAEVVTWQRRTVSQTLHDKRGCK